MVKYLYNVNGTEFFDITPFGAAWKKAKAMAKEEHTYITRTVVNGSAIRYEFYAEAGIFLPMKFFDEVKVCVF